LEATLKEQDWEYPAPPKYTIDNSNEIMVEEEEDNEISNPEESLNEFEAYESIEAAQAQIANIQSVAISFIRDLAHSCPLCSYNMHPFSNNCPILRELVPGAKCTVCMSPNHTFESVGKWLKKNFKSIPDEEVKLWGEYSNQEEKRNGLKCSIFVNLGDNICEKCWMKHDGGPDDHVGSPYAIRMIALYIWYNQEHRNEFLNNSIYGPTGSWKNRIVEAQNQGKGLPEYMHWVMYGSEQKLLNVYGIIMFFKDIYGEIKS
jgi:hypothetical protein